MVWEGGFKGNLQSINDDIEKLGNLDKAYIVAVLFSFENAPEWAPFYHERDKGDIDGLYKKVIDELGKPTYKGAVHAISNPEVKGKLKLVAWKSTKFKTKRF